MIGRCLGLGVQVVPLIQQHAVGQGVSIGVRVDRVYKNAAAAALGIRRGDIITAVNGRAVANVVDLREVVLGSQVGDAVRVLVHRHGEAVLLEGGVYGTWPEAIACRPLAAVQMRRFPVEPRDRMRQHLRQIDQLAKRHADLTRELSEMLESGAANNSCVVRCRFAISSEVD